MTRPTRPLTLFATALALACTPDPANDGESEGSESAGTTTDTETTDTTDGETGGEPAPECAPPDVAGAHAVAFEDLELEDPLRDAPLAARVAYPSDGADPPYPLVVFSHGFLMDPQTYDYLFELLASHGFVVIGTKHVDSAEYVAGTLLDACETIPEDQQAMMFAEVFASLFEPDHPLRRPADMSNLIDHAEALSAGDGPLAGLVDTARVGAVGHSFGGFTSLMASGAEVDLDGMTDACAGGPTTWLSELVVGDPLLGLMCFVFGSVTEDSLAQPFDVIDERIAAVATLAGPLDLVWGPSAGGLGAVDLPALMVYTDTDLNVDYAGTAAAYESFGSPKHFLTLAGGTHGNFGTIDYDYFDGLIAQVPDGCAFKVLFESTLAEDQMPTLAPEDQTWLTGAAVAAFLQHHLAGATGCEDYFDPAYYESLVPGVTEYVSD